MTTLQQIADQQASPEVPINEDFETLSAYAIFGKRHPATSGLVWGYYGGQWGTLIADGTVTLAGSATNHVVVDRNTGIVSVASGSPDPWSDTDNYARLYEIVTTSLAVSTVVDYRASPGGLMGGGDGGGALLALDDLSDVAAAAPADGDSLVWDAYTGAWVSGDAGGLNNWTDALNTSSPNATVPVVSLTASNAATTVDISIVPKAGGAIQAQVPNNLTSGGNKRGPGATDFQRGRTANDQVASGAYSCTMGYGSKASGDYSSAFGSGHSVTGTYAVALNGDANVVSGNYAACIAGSGNTASGNRSVVIGGYTCVSNAFASTALGSFSNTRSIDGSFVLASTTVSGSGDSQMMMLELHVATTNATQTTLCSENNSAAANNQLTLPNDSAYVVTGLVVGRQNTTGDSASWEFKAHIRRGSNAASTAMVASCTPTQIAADSGASTWALAVDANTTLGCLRIRVTGEASKNIRWVCSVISAQIVG